MNRRAFLGSVLGTVAGVPFLAKSFFEAPSDGFRLGLFTNEGLLAAPTTVEPERLPMGWLFKAHDLKIAQPIIYRGVVLFKDKTQLAKSLFSREIHCNVGDTLMVNYRLEAGRPFTIEEMLKELSPRPLNNIRGKLI